VPVLSIAKVAYYRTQGQRSSEALGSILYTHYGGVSFAEAEKWQEGEGMEYAGGAITDVQTAILYCLSKLRRKVQHHAGSAAVSTGVSAVTTATGATIGSIVPVAGTLAGGAGGFALGTGISMGLERGFRGLNALRKTVTGKRGTHRREAASVLADAYMGFSRPSETDQIAATKTLEVLLGEGYLQLITEGGGRTGQKWGESGDDLESAIFASLASW
jgi:hypothetical protein